MIHNTNIKSYICPKR